MPGTEVDIRRPSGLPEGLEDLDPSDLQLPMIRVNHKEATYTHSLSGEELDEIECIALGLLKQRILWPAEVSDDGDPPLCQSLNFTEGRPSEGKFPVKASGFGKDDVAAAIPDPDTGLQEEGTALPCKDCELKDWGSHPTRDVPWCSEQHTYPILIVHRDAEGEVESLERAVISFSKTGIKPSKAYVTAFVSRKKAMYTAYTRLTLKAQSRGSVDFAVPSFQMIGDTPEEEWPEYSLALRSMREFLLTPRASRTSDDEEDEDETPVRRTRTPAAKRAAAAVEKATVEDDDEAEVVGEDGDAPVADAEPERPAKPAKRARPVPDDEEPF